MKTTLIGRKKEQALLKKALKSEEAEMIAVYGRRRIGKTFIIKTVYENQIDFEITGIQDAPRKEQLANFAYQLNEAANGTLIAQTPPTWFDAFVLLITFLKKKDQNEKLIVFLDELPWLATHKSGFLRGLSFFWNSWAVNQNILVVICGSAASWMIKKVIRHKGGLHNRITQRIHLKPFTLAETNEYLESKNIHFDHYQLLQLYMAMGGVPHYLKEIQPARSAIQNIDRICFSEEGLLYDEFLSLYAALFDHAERHVEIIRILANKKEGLRRKNIVENISFSDGSQVTKTLEELTQSGFISTYLPFGNKQRYKLYRLTDQYSLFYLNFIENNKLQGDSIWKSLSQTQRYKVWSGYAFENICLQHISQIKKALGISGVYSVAASFSQQGTDIKKGTQIDLVIDRNDHIVNLFEIKFYNTSFSLTKDYAKNLRNKIAVFKEVTKTNKQIFITLITTFGLNYNKHSLGLISESLEMDILFEP